MSAPGRGDGGSASSPHLEAEVAPIAEEEEWVPMPEILHITPRARWGGAVAEGEYRGDTLATEGFIHGSTPGQLPWVAETFDRGQIGLPDDQ